MKSGMDEMKETQQKMFDTWKEWTEQWMKVMPGNTTPSSAKDFFTPWMGTQPKWKAEDWGMQQWQHWMEQSNQWIRQNMLDKIPSNMKPHYQNFTVLYDEMAKYWEPMQRMIQYGTFSKGTAEQFFTPEAYRKIVGLFMGFRPVNDAHKLIDDVNTFFEDYINSLKRMTPGSHEFIDSWTRFFRDMGRTTGHPGLQAVADVTKMVEKGLNSFYHVAGPSEELAMAKVLKDIQFVYINFLGKSSEMQQVLLDAGQFALPDTIKSFSDEFQQTKKLPNYTEFFNRYANHLEDYLMDVLESKEYSLLQAEVSKMGIIVKAKMDEFVELAFNDFPFLMKSFADEVAQENQSLRRKMRDLENRLYALESSIYGGGTLPKEEIQAPVRKSTPAVKKTAK